MLDMFLAQAGGFDFNGFVNSIIGNPLVGGGLGWLFGGPFGALVGGLASNTLGQSNVRNAESDERIAGLEGAISDYTDTINGIRASLPAYQINGNIFGNVGGVNGISAASSGNKGDEAIKYAQGARPGGSGGQGIINFDDLFQGPQQALDAYNANLPDLNQSFLNFDDEIRRVQAAGHSGEDLIASGSRDMLNTLHGSLAATGNLFGGARLDKGELISQVDLPDTDLTALLNSRLAGVGEAGRIAGDTQREALAGQAATYGGLENLKTIQDQASNAITRGTALRGSQEAADVRMQELAAQEFVAGLQGQLSSTEAQINASLASEQARQENLIRGQIAGTQGETAQMLAELGIRTAGDVNALALGEETGNADIELGNINRGAANASILAQLTGAVGNADTQRTTTGLDALFRGLGFESNLAGNLAESNLALGNIFSNSGLIGNTDLMAHELLAGIFPGRFGGGGGGGGDGGGGSGFNVDLGTAVGTGAAALGTAAASGIGGWGAAAAAPFVTGFFCLADDTLLQTPEGNKTLQEIKVGDEVKNSKGKWRKVKRKEWIFHTGSDVWTVLLSEKGKDEVVLPLSAIWPTIPENHFVELHTGAGTLICTRDHIVSGKDAEDWRIGDTMSYGFNDTTLTQKVYRGMTPCGDIELEDGSDYMANGFPVKTMIRVVEPDLAKAPYVLPDVQKEKEGITEEVITHE